MKIAAHPMVVAVALGLLGPGALEIVEDESAAAPLSLEEWQDVSPPSAEELDALEAEWAALTR